MVKFEEFHIFINASFLVSVNMLMRPHMDKYIFKINRSQYMTVLILSESIAAWLFSC